MQGRQVVSTAWLADCASQAVLVQTALSHEGPWQRELFAMFEGAIATQG